MEFQSTYPAYPSLGDNILPTIIEMKQQKIELEAAKFHSAVGAIRTKLNEQADLYRELQDDYTKLEVNYLQLEEVCNW